MMNLKWIATAPTGPRNDETVSAMKTNKSRHCEEGEARRGNLNPRFLFACATNTRLIMMRLLRPFQGLAMTNVVRLLLRDTSLLAMTTLLVALIFPPSAAMAIQDTQQYETYLNSIKTLSGEFTQVNNKGRAITGKIQISRPGKMRLEYNPPSPLVIVSDGKWLINYDKDSKEVTYLTLEKTPAYFILRPNIRFSGDVAITSVVPHGDSTEITFIQKEDPDEGHITLVFENNPIALTAWKVVDAQGVETRVILSNMKSNVQLPSGLFNIKSPNLIQQIF